MYSKPGNHRKRQPYRIGGINKITCVGNSGVGKSTLLASYQSKSFFENAPKIHTATIEEEFENKIISLQLFDTAGADGYDRLRPLSYPNSDIVLICFSVVDRSSFNAVRSKWHPEVTHHCPNIPILLVGTKSDLRNDSQTIKELNADDHSIVTYEEGEELALDLNIECYIETSSYNVQDLNNLMNLTKQLLLKYKKPEKMSCIVL